MIIRAFTALCLSLALAGCLSSPPAQFFTLNAVAGSDTSHPNANTPVQVAAVHIPPELDRQEMVRKTSANESKISDRHRWVAPLNALAQRVLTQDLAQRLPADSVLLPKDPAPANTHQVVLNILQFENNGAGELVFDGSWTLLRSGSDQPVHSRHVQLTVPAANTDYAAQAQAMSTILGRIADQIAATIAGDSHPEQSNP